MGIKRAIVSVRGLSATLRPASIVHGQPVADCDMRQTSTRDLARSSARDVKISYGTRPWRISESEKWAQARFLPVCFQPALPRHPKTGVLLECAICGPAIG